MSNPFFKNNGPVLILDILKILDINLTNLDEHVKINDIKDLSTSTKLDVTFFHSQKYKELAKKTKASYCITTEFLKNELPTSCVPLIVENVLVSVSKITSIFYPEAVNDDFDNSAINISETDLKDKVIYGKNVLIGKNVSIGKNCKIGHNTIIEKNVSIGNDCSIGSNTIIRNSLISNNVKILDNCVLGKHGFGFFPNKIKNLRYPHIGIVIIEENCEIGCGSNI
jgi:UDP-3-O-[3-hydroxymyristoyl] glucosamine N-acyltransferase